ncbi:hypothetical protein [Chryseobacterium shigense]|uniref:Uncharacterized protein n=1 Tax=Chryseobacterium shigense TaxID=297244 RepID=A0A841N8X6_9FLAO|nr:hypothetical protein [Chryseobacterium shigense]MBB6370018.1 hypothetical protein [Chryseobacterium shigense]
MCNYIYKNKGRNNDGKTCYYSDKSKPQFLELPLDNEGYCIFHSRDKEFKSKNSFETYFEKLLSTISLVFKDTDKIFWKYDFVGFVFTEDLLLNNMEFNNSIDLSNSNFYGKFKLINISTSSINLMNSHFSDLVLFESVNIGFNIYGSNSIFDYSLSIKTSEFNGASYFENCIFNNPLNSPSCELSIKNSKIHSVTFENSSFTPRVAIDGNTLNQEVIFDKCNMLNEFLFENNVVNGLIGIRETEFLLPENLNNFYSGVTFGNNIINETGKILFRGKKPMDKMVKSEMAFYYKQTPKGLISFENFDLNTIYLDNKIKLLELEKENPNIVSISPSCSKYSCRTEDFIIETSEANQNFILDLTNVFCNYFKLIESTNLGVEIVEQKKDFVRYYYFTDEKLELEEFYIRIQKNEIKIWETLNNLSAIVKTAIVSQNTELLDCLIELDSWWKKLGLRIIQNKMNKYEVSNVLNSISIDKKTEEQVNLFIEQISNRINFSIHNNILITETMANINFNDNHGEVNINDFSQQYGLNVEQTSKLLEIVETVKKTPPDKKSTTLEELCKSWFPTIAATLSESIKPFVL